VDRSRSATVSDVVRVPIADLTAGERQLDAATAHYVGRVLRLRAGDAFVAFDPATGREADARAHLVGADAVTVRIEVLRPGGAPDTRDVTWIQALAKADKCDAVVRDATELGATRIIVAVAKRSVVRLDADRAASRASRWERIAREAARQCGRSHAPAVDVPAPWHEALARVTAEHARFCLWERATEPLGVPLLDALSRSAPLAFACGPEGGLDETEVEVARSSGWRVVSLGRRILRTETVAAAVLGAVAVWSASIEP
jgi:16S rRNA (uracil1498-N3)-methyltransferase